VIGLKGVPAAHRWDELRARAATLERRHAMPFGRYVDRLRRMNRCTREALLTGS
jgi:hypothetical protein